MLKTLGKKGIHLKTFNNTRGLTLLEMLMALVLLGIIVQVVMMLQVQANRTIVRLQKKIEQAEAAKASVPVLQWTDKVLDGSYTKVLCFTGNATYSCLPAACSFVNGGWTDGSHKCTGGVLYY